MAWITPKTDWKVTIEDGVYAGDYFTYSDYNRIKNNIEYLAQMQDPHIPISYMGEDKAIGDLIYPNDFNHFEQNLFMIAQAVDMKYTGYPVFIENGNTPTFENLNQIESFTLYMYEVLSGSAVYAIDTHHIYAVSNGKRAKARAN